MGVSIEASSLGNVGKNTGWFCVRLKADLPPPAHRGLMVDLGAPEFVGLHCRFTGVAVHVVGHRRLATSSKLHSRSFPSMIQLRFLKTIALTASGRLISLLCVSAVLHSIPLLWLSPIRSIAWTKCGSHSRVLSRFSPFGHLRESHPTILIRSIFDRWSRQL